MTHPFRENPAGPSPVPRRRAPIRGLAGALAIAAGLCAGVAVPAATAQPERSAGPADREVYERRPIREIVLRRPGPPDEDRRPTYEPLTGTTRQAALNNIRSYEGAPFRASTVDSDVRRLNRLLLFARVETAVQLLDDGSVRLIFTLIERPIIQDVQATGNRRISDGEIAQAIDLLAGTPVDRFQVDRAARRIEDLYRERGFYLAQVTVDEREMEESGIVLFMIREGERVRVTDIRFEGNRSFADRELRREVGTRVAGIFRRGQLDDAELDGDVANLISFYRDRGHLDVRADRLVQPSPDGREAIVTFLIDEGPVYTLRSVRFRTEDGDPVFSEEQVRGLIPLKPGDVYGARALRQSTETLARAYGQLGYVDVSIARVERRDPERPVVDLELTASQGERYLTGEVIISGNELTKQKVIRRHVEVRPGRPLDTTAVDRTERRIHQLRLFSPDPRDTSITIQSPDRLEPEYRDVLIEVRETNTGDLSLGGAVSSDAGVVGRIALTQRNFDIADTPDSLGELMTGRAFRGAGQTFQIEALPGNRIQTYSVSLSEPYLFESDYSASTQLFYRARDFREFDEERIGARFSFGRRFGTRWSGALNLRVDSVNLTNIDPSRPTDVFDVEDRNVITGVGASFLRSTLDDSFRPGRGSRTRVGFEQTGLMGGDFDYTRLDFEHRTYLTIREDFLGRRTVLSLSNQIGYIPQGRSGTPTYERYYLGGQSFRGFDFRTVSPKGIRNDTREPTNDAIGGTWLFFAGAEVQQPVFEEIVSVVGFVDTGTVTFSPGFDDYRVSAGLGMRLYVPQLSPAPLAFDFGFPIVRGPGDRNRVFTFSIDVPF